MQSSGLKDWEIKDQLMGKGLSQEEMDEALYPYVRAYVVRTQACSVTGIQRHFRIGYVWAARIVDALEKRGVVSQYLGATPRKVLVSE